MGGTLLLPLGGLGEIGKNMTVFEFGGEIIVVDCGLAFPEPEMYGIDIVIPDIAYLRDKREQVTAFVITHAHEDHIGALPYVLPEFPGVPVYASTLARGLISNKIKERRLRNNPLEALEPGTQVLLQVGPSGCPRSLDGRTVKGLRRLAILPTQKHRRQGVERLAGGQGIGIERFERFAR